MRIYRLSELTPEKKEKIMRRAEIDIEAAMRSAREIIDDVRARGDVAVREYTKKFDGVDIEPSHFLVSRKEMGEAECSLAPELKRAIRRAARNIERFHRRQMPKAFELEVEKGIVVGRRILPFQRAGIYVPGGKALYPSVVLMLGIAAKVAGVKEIIMCTPPQAAKGACLYAASLCGARVYRVGGVPAIAAMAYGTESIPKVSVIAGPGNPYVVAAQKVVSETVRIPFLPGPSEGMVLADGHANPHFVALDVLSEAEHGPDSAGVLVTNSESLAVAVKKEASEILHLLPEPRRSYIEENMKKYSCAVITNTLEEAIEFANEYAPEHIVVNTKNAPSVARMIKNAGTVCIGEYTPITLGNFIAGTNAILPTGGRAKLYSGISVETFLRMPTYEKASKHGLARVANDIALMSNYEGFPAHTLSVKKRINHS